MMPLADLSVEPLGPLVVARLEGEIDMSNAGELGEAIGRQVVNEALGLVVDLSRIEYLDSAGIQTVYELHERLQTRGQDMRLVVPPGSPIAEALRLADVSSAVGTVETLDEAVRALNA